MATIKFLSSLAYDITKESIELEINNTINLKQILSELSVKYPKINEKIIMNNETITKHIVIMINGLNISHLDGIKTEIKNTDKIIIFTSISGG
tara:strand:- start:412 stop:690 length:279 start_codon:yes stop_codon:yes gene_type:complete